MTDTNPAFLAACEATRANLAAVDISELIDAERRKADAIEETAAIEVAATARLAELAAEVAGHDDSEAGRMASALAAFRARRMGEPGPARRTLADIEAERVETYTALRAARQRQDTLASGLDALRDRARAAMAAPSAPLIQHIAARKAALIAELAAVYAIDGTIAWLANRWTDDELREAAAAFGRSMPSPLPVPAELATTYAAAPELLRLAHVKVPGETAVPRPSYDPTPALAATLRRDTSGSGGRAAA